MGPGGGGYRSYHGYQGRPAPVIITDEMVAGMKAGSITDDLAAEDKGLGAGGASCDFTDDMGRGRREGGGRIN